MEQSKVMIMLEGSELEALIERGVTRALARQPKQDKKQVERPIKIEEAAKVVNLAVRTIYGKVKDNEIPCYRHHGNLYFFESELIEQIRTGRITTNERARAQADKYLNEAA